jgi:hypothetical protein
MSLSSLKKNEKAGMEQSQPAFSALPLGRLGRVKYVYLTLILISFSLASLVWKIYV